MWRWSNMRNRAGNLGNPSSNEKDLVSMPASLSKKKSGIDSEGTTMQSR